MIELIVGNSDLPHQANYPIVIQVSVNNGDVKVQSFCSNMFRQGYAEDKRIADKIELAIKEGFKQYHQDKQKGAIDV